MFTYFWFRFVSLSSEAFSIFFTLFFNTMNARRLKLKLRLVSFVATHVIKNRKIYVATYVDIN